jgi:hypothetical protein
MCYRCDDAYYAEPCSENSPGCLGDCEVFKCAACEVNTLHINEYYMLTDEVWNAAWPTGRGMLCIGCLEDRLGRQLTSDDFTDAPINQGYFGYSERLRQRLAGSIPTSNE